MASQLPSPPALAILLVILALSTLITRRLQKALFPRPKMKTDALDLMSIAAGPSMLSKCLSSALPDSVIFPHDAVAFKDSMNAYWAQQEREAVPACVVRPRDVEQLCTAVTILKQEYSIQVIQAGEEKPQGLFAIRSGGHSPISGAASINGGILIDLCHFREVTPSEDGMSVVIGTGAKWRDVSKTLDEKGLAVVGGRNSAVGVGGLTLGGKLVLLISRLSPFSHLDGVMVSQDAYRQVNHRSV